MSTAGCTLGGLGRKMTMLVQIDEADGDVVQVTIPTPVGDVKVLGIVRIENRTSFIDNAQVDGPGRGMLGRAGLNAIGAELLAEADVDEIVLQGSARTTGRNPGRKPKVIRHPH